MAKILIFLFLFTAIVLVLYCVISTPRSTSLQPALQTKSSFPYETNLEFEVDATLPEKLMLRRVAGSTWQTSGGHTKYVLDEYIEPSMSVVNIKPDAYLVKSPSEPKRMLIGRLTDQGSGMHRWHVTMIRIGKEPIQFERHQRYRVWIEKDAPTGFNDNGEPVNNDPKRWYFSGPADIVAKDSYDGYVEPQERDL